MIFKIMNKRSASGNRNNNISIDENSPSYKQTKKLTYGKLPKLSN